MIGTSPRTEVDLLAERLHRGMDLLFDMERRGERTGEYDRYLRIWNDLLTRYETLEIGESSSDGEKLADGDAGDSTDQPDRDHLHAAA